jgi:putative oxidoreductase
MSEGFAMNFIVNLLILLPAQIASYFSWAGPTVITADRQLHLHDDRLGQAHKPGAGHREFHRMGYPFSKDPHPFVSGVECLAAPC